MAKMNFEFDTETKQFTASVDGTSVPNAIGVSINRSWDDDDEFQCVIIASKKDETTDITEIRQLIASQTLAGKELAAKKDGKSFPSKDFPGFVESRDTSHSKACLDIQAAFGCK